MKFAEPRPFSDPEAAVRKLIEIANAAEPRRRARPGRPHLYRAGQWPLSRRRRQSGRIPRGIERAIAKGWLWRHESGTYVKFTDAGAELFA